MKSLLFWNPNGRPFWRDDETTPRQLSRDLYETMCRIQVNHAKCFRDFIGNEKAVRRLKMFAYDAILNDRFHRCDQNFALLGPSSTGKTTLAKIFAEILEISFVEIQPRSVGNLDDVLYQIAKVCEEHVCEMADGNFSLELIPEKQDSMKFKLPSMVVFLDEVHALKNNIVQGLLKAVERNDGELVTEKGYILDCSNVCWIIATTDRGLLFDAFDTRFSKINLKPYSKEEISKIVAKNYDFPEEVCDMIVHYSHDTPRESLAFAKEVQLLKRISNDDDWKDVVEQVAEDNGIDEWGMTYRRVDILTALGQQGPISKNSLINVANCKQEELEKFIMPTLLSSSLVRVTSCGYSITPKGLEQLDVRGIANLGDQAIPENIRLTMEKFNTRN